jgi:hypothetical protein
VLVGIKGFCGSQPYALMMLVLAEASLLASLELLPQALSPRARTHAVAAKSESLELFLIDFAPLLDCGVHKVSFVHVGVGAFFSPTPTSFIALFLSQLSNRTIPKINKRRIERLADGIPILTEYLFECQCPIRIRLYSCLSHVQGFFVTQGM